MRKLSLELSLVIMAVFVACDSSGTNANMDLLGGTSDSFSELDDEYDGEAGDDDRDSLNPSKEVASSSSSEADGSGISEGSLSGDSEATDTSVFEGSSSGYFEAMDSSVSEGSSSSDSEATGSNVSEGSSSSYFNVISSSSRVYSSSDASIYDAAANTLMDLRDGQVYRTTTIDVPAKNYSEVWMAENLNYAAGSYSYCYGGEPSNCTKYGHLYSWPAAIGKPYECSDAFECGLGDGDIRGVCPKGWHLPSYDEWGELLAALGGSGAAGKVLKSKTGWESCPEIENTDAFGFSALPAGSGNDGNFGIVGSSAYFWSSSENPRKFAYRVAMGCYDDGAYLVYDNKYFGFSVRCLKD